MTSADFFFFNEQSNACAFYRFQEGLSLVKAIHIFIFHYEEVCCINDHSLQTNE